MARKNSKAGQPNREAQKMRRSFRVTTNVNFNRRTGFVQPTEQEQEDDQ